MRVLLWLLGLVSKALSKLGALIMRVGVRMRGRYKARTLTLIVLASVLVLGSIMLFVPPYLGLSNDGSFDTVMADTGLKRLDEDDPDAYFSYYDRVYRLETVGAPPKTTCVPLKLAVSAAKMLDTACTWDEYFDMRFLALIYLALYVPALYPLVYALLCRSHGFTERVVTAVLCVLVFADVSVITRFASLYTQPIELLMLLLTLDLMLLTARHGGDGPYPFLMAIPVAVLMFTNAYCALAGIVVSALYWSLSSLKLYHFRRAICAIFALMMSAVTVVTAQNMISSQTCDEKYNQMTRGVLFESTNPEETLAEFGISARYSILTDTYADQSYPVVLPSDGVLDEEFLDKYDVPDVLMHYARNPGALLGLYDIGVQKAFITRSDYSGNYEKSVGMPKHAKSMFMSLWSTFKDRTIPKTVGFEAIIIAALVLAYRRKNRDKEDEETAVRESLFRLMVGIVVGFSILQMLTVVVMSGDSKLIRESFVMGCCMDVLMVLLINEMLHKLNILKADD